MDSASTWASPSPSGDPSVPPSPLATEGRGADSLRINSNYQDKLGAEPLDVLAAFTAAGVRPLAVRMGGRRYEPLQVHATHTVREGRTLWRIFSVSDAPPARPPESRVHKESQLLCFPRDETGGAMSSPRDSDALGNHFTLAFNPNDLRWRLWERE